MSSENPNTDMVSPATLQVTSLAGRFDTTGYPTPHSDIVALMMLEHQSRLLNLMARAGWEERIGLDAGAREPGIRELVDYLLFVDETPLPGPVRGTSRFSQTFENQGPRDTRGRSLRELECRTRMMRYPCSFLIYSEPFDALPPKTRAAVYERMWAILSGAVQDSRYQRLSPSDREAIVEILRDTKPDLPAYFGESNAVSP